MYLERDRKKQWREAKKRRERRKEAINSFSKINLHKIQMPIRKLNAKTTRNLNNESIFPVKCKQSRNLQGLISLLKITIVIK